MKLEMKGAPGFFSLNEKILRETFLNQVELIPDGDKLKKCIQCGTCTGSCPVSYVMDLSPRSLFAYFRAGDIETILKSRTIWICASCYSCHVRCPSGIKITDILYALKRVAMERKVFPKRTPVFHLSENFVKMVNKYGRNYELGLLFRFLLRTQPLKLLKSSSLGFKLWKRGRLSLFPKRIKNKQEMIRIMKKAGEIDETIFKEAEKKVVVATVGYELIAD